MYSILVVDDDPVSRLRLQRSLSEQGYHVEIAESSQAGIEKAQALLPALIICDWMMPSGSGLEVCRFVKSHPQLCTAFFILLSSRIELDDRPEGLKAEADEFLLKPINLNELQTRVQTGLRLYQLNQDLQAQKQAFETELAEAASYIRSLLPPPLLAPLHIESLFLPSRYLGGDCFDYFRLSDETFALYLLDVSGHGLGAALPSVSLLNLLRSQSLQGINYGDPAAVLTALNRAFQMSNHNDKYFTIWYGVYHLSQQRLTYASAGHPPALLWTHIDQPCQRLKTPGYPIGCFAEASYANSTRDLPAGSLMYVLSDGVYEVRQSEGQIWGLDAFEALLQNCPECHHQPLPQILNRIRSSAQVNAFQDDFSLLKIRFP